MSPSFRLVQTRPTGHTRARGVVSEPASGGRIDVATYAPPSELAGLVASYWVGRWQLQGQPPHTSQILSDPCVHFAFERGTQHAEARLVGVWTKLWTRTLEGRGLVRAAKLKAGALRAFVNQPADSFANRIVPLDTIFGAEADDVRTCVLESDDDQQGFEALHHWLLARCRYREDENVSLAVALVELIANNAELISVEQLSGAAGMTKRSLQRLFKDYVGSSPKWTIRRNRLQEAALRLERGGQSSLTQIALELGYSDHAHFTRDFRSAVGKSPSEFAASMREQS